MNPQVMSQEVGALSHLHELSALHAVIPSLVEELGDSLPVPPAVIADRGGLRGPMKDTLAQVPRLRFKSQVVLAGYELLMLETLAEMGIRSEVVVAVDHGLPDDIFQRMSANIPDGLDVRVCRVPNLPLLRGPVESVVIAAGLQGGAGFVLLPVATRNTLEFYRALARTYYGEVICVDPWGEPILTRHEGWVPVRCDRAFTRVVAHSRDTLEEAI